MTATLPRLTPAQADELRAVYAAPGHQFASVDGPRARRALRLAGLVACEGANDWRVTEAGVAWLEGNP